MLPAVLMRGVDYQKLFEAAPVPIIVLDRDLRVVAVNDAYLGATLTTRDTLLGRGLFEALPPDPAQAQAQGVVRRLLERVLAERAPQRLALQRYDVPRPEGGYERRYWNAELAPLFGPDGEVEHIRCTVEEVTDRAHDARLRQLWNVEGVGVLFFDRQGTLISANDTFLRWTGYSAEDVASGRLHWRTFTPPEYIEASVAEEKKLKATGRSGPYEKEYLTRSGARRWMLFVGAALADGTVGEFVLDVSERKAAEAAKREAELRYRTLFDSIDAGFCVIEMIYDGEGRPYDYRFLEVNPAFERQTGMKDPTSKTMREHIPNHEDDWFEIYGRVADTGEPVRFVNEAGMLQRWFELYAFRVGDPAARRVGVLFNDITERVLAQRALEQEARRKDEFLATLAHELRNPLAPIRNAVSLLQLRSDADEELREVGSLLDRQVTQLARLVDDLLDVSRVTFGKVNLQRAPLDLREAARDALATSQPLFAVKSHRVELALGDEPVWVDGDRVRLAQVLANLLSNAARYTPPAGSIALRLSAAGGEACIAVEDNGIGIERADLERVFEPFAQVHKREAANAGGIGIGLALSRSLVELHGGRIRAESAGRGAGSRFVVSLPRVEHAKPAAEPSRQAGGRPARRVLVVDDNVDLAVSQAALLQRMGHEVEVAYNGEAALDKAREFHPDLVLLDLGMPGMDGFEVARRLRAEHPGGLKIVAQTGWGQKTDRRRTREAGFDEHLAKPVDLASLLQLL
ncbi:MAG TPA: PAS domain-containing protein [Burkholderiales bacterium]|nr:PAS domain-containing protein [Burkholderiales bacterium]